MQSEGTNMISELVKINSDANEGIITSAEAVNNIARLMLINHLNRPYINIDNVKVNEKVLNIFINRNE
jgi:hypothetical protein